MELERITIPFLGKGRDIISGHEVTIFMNLSGLSHPAIQEDDICLGTGQ
jgi:hypothetical protein